MWNHAGKERALRSGDVIVWENDQPVPLLRMYAMSKSGQLDVLRFIDDNKFCCKGIGTPLITTKEHFFLLTKLIAQTNALRIEIIHPTEESPQILKEYPAYRFI